MNKIMLIGNVVHTPEKRTTNSGIPVCSFSIAVKRRYKDASGDYQTDFFDVQAWRQLADRCEKYVEKGKRVAVVGSMQSRDYTAKDGGKRRAWDVIADEVEFLSSKSAEGAEPAERPRTTTESAEAQNAPRMPKEKRPVPDVLDFTATDDDLPF